MDFLHPGHFAITFGKGLIPFVIDLHTVTPVVLGLVASQVGSRKCHIGRFSRRTQMNQANAGGRNKFGGVPHQFGLTDHRTNLLGTLLANRQRTIEQDDAEFVPPHARKDIMTAQAMADVFADQAQQLITRRVPAGIIHHLELVEINEQQDMPLDLPSLIITCAQALERTLQLLLERPPVEQ